MSIATEISRIQANKNTIKAKLVELGMATNTDNLDRLAAAIENIVNQGAVSITVREGDTYTIPAGYHNGSGTVSGVAGGGNYTLQSKTATPTKKQQNVTPDSGYYGISDVTIAPIPDAYQDVTSVTAGAGDVLTGKIIVTSDGTVTTGTMTNNGNVAKTLDATTITYTIPKGYHGGTGKVSIVLEEKTVTPTKTAQTVTPTTGKVLSKVVVNPIPDEYITTDDATAAAENILNGKTAYINGEKVTGAMDNVGAIHWTLDTRMPERDIPEGYHNGEGTMRITLETKSENPSKSRKTITPSEGKVLSQVIIEPIPDIYQDITVVTATEPDVLDGKVIIKASGVTATGSMPNNGSVAATIDGLTSTSVTIPAGYTTGGTVSLTSDIEDALAAI